MRVIRESSREAVDRAVFEEFCAALRRRPAGVIGLATGGTFSAFFARIAQAVAAGELEMGEVRATHLDEYLGFDHDQRGGMVHELTSLCPPLRQMLDEDRFWPVPASGDAGAVQEHEQRLAEVGGVDIQFLGIGRNGHIGFNEPGTSFDLGFHRVHLAPTTRADARDRFAPDEPPYEAVTAGPKSILKARRIVLSAVGAAKAPAVRAMLEGPIDPQCPASCVRYHADSVVYLDPEAAAELGESAAAMS